MNAELRGNLRRWPGGRRRVPTILQMEATECGAACLAMILAHHGRWVSLEELRIRCGVSRDGANAASIARAAREYGLVARGFAHSRKTLFELPFPMVLYWSRSHFVVLEGIRGDRFYINDPNDGPRRVSAREFDDGYTGIGLAFAPGPDFRKGGSKPSIVRGLRARFGNARGALAFAAVATLTLLVPGVAVPTMARVFVDNVLVLGNDDWVLALLIGLTSAAGLQGALVWLQRAFLARMEAKLSILMTTRFFWHLATLPMPFFGQRWPGDLVNRVASNDAVAGLLSDELAVNVINVAAMGFYAAVMATYDVGLTLFAVGIAAVNLAVLLLASRSRQDANRRLLREEGNLAGAAVDGVRTIESLKATGAESDFFMRWSGLHANVLSARQRLMLVTTLAGVAPPLLSLLGVIAVLGVGGLRVLDGTLTIGGSGRLPGPDAELLAAGGRPRPVRCAPPDGQGRPRPARRRAALRAGRAGRARHRRGRRRRDGGPAAGSGRARRGDLRVQRQGAAVDRGLLAHDRAGPARGAGRQLRQRQVDGGPARLRPALALVRYGADRRARPRRPASRAPVRARVLRRPGARPLRGHRARERVPVGPDGLGRPRRPGAARRCDPRRRRLAGRKYDARVEEGGSNFSGGQRQRLEIARALARNPAILVLDEATSALDPVTEVEIDEHLRQRGCTCLIIAHRLSTIRDADEIVVLDRGRIVQRGTHQRLTAEEGLYRTLVTGAADRGDSHP